MGRRPWKRQYRAVLIMSACVCVCHEPKQSQRKELHPPEKLCRTPNTCCFIFLQSGMSMGIYVCVYNIVCMCTFYVHFFGLKGLCVEFVLVLVLILVLILVLVLVLVGTVPSDWEYIKSRAHVQSDDMEKATPDREVLLFFFFFF